MGGDWKGGRAIGKGREIRKGIKGGWGKGLLGENGWVGPKVSGAILAVAACFVPVATFGR